MSARITAVLYLLVLAASPARAVAVQLTLDGKPITGAEVCWFAAGAPDDPVERFTSFKDVTCGAALPQTGIYNVFARNTKNGLVSRDVFLLRDGRLDVDRIELVPAQRVPIGDRGAVYVESTGNVLPLVPGEKEVLVPRESAIVPFVIGDRALVAVGVVLANGRPRTRSAPTVEITTSHGVRQSINRLDPLLAGRPAIAFFRDVPDEKTRAHLSGKGWLEDEVAIEHGRAIRPLRTAPASVVTVRWSVPPDMAAYSAPKNSCGPAPLNADPAITIARCPSTCTTVRTIALDRTATSGEIAVQGLPSGSYQLRLAYHELPAVATTLQFDDADSVVDLNSRPDRFFGRVTREGKPYHAFVAIGEGAVSDPDTGEYVALSSPAPKSDPAAERRFFKDPNPIAVRGCDATEETLYVPDAAPIPNSRFDIDLTATAVHVSVLDGGSGAAIEGAAVKYRVMRRDDLDVTLFEGSAAKTDADGKSQIAGLPQKRRIVVCASHEHYSSACAPPFTLDASSADVSVSLTRTDTRRGTVSNAAAAGGRVVWVTPSGDLSESSTIAPDGSFTYARPHDAGELVCVVSAAAPLLVLRYPPLAPDATFDISYAGLAVRDFHAVLPPAARETKGFLDISIGDAVVPLPIFSEHLGYRGSRPVFLAPRTIDVPQIAVTAPVTFLFAPITWAEANSGGRGVDFFYLPAARALPRVAPDSRGVAVVGE
ncbi:MAG TPA: hypothetical protein VGJ82_06495 [Thermoanaerobaculia bacterium]